MAKFKAPRKGNKPQAKRKKKMVPGWGGSFGRAFGVMQKASTKGGLAYRAFRMAKKLSNAINTEYKAYDVTSVAGSVDYNGGVSSLAALISQGTTDNQRIGDSLKLQNLTLRYIGVRNTADSILRVMVIFDPQNKISAVTDVLAATGSAISVVSPKNYDKRFYSNVLYDRTMTLTSADHPYVIEDIVIPVDKHVQYSGGTTTVNTGDLKLLVISNVVTTNLPTLTYYARLTYTDD